MNILILSAGTRVQLVRFFKKTNGINQVITVDCSKYAPALYEGSLYYIVPKMNEEAYIPSILTICEKNNINVILPLQENELELMAEVKEIFEKKGISVVISPIETIRLCRDKYKLARYMDKQGIRCVPTFKYNIDKKQIENISFPVLIKQQYGAGSIGMLKADCMELLDAYNRSVGRNLIVQPYLEAKEFGVDVYVDMISGEIINIFIKKKIRMRAGETEKSVSVKDPKLFEFIKKIVNVTTLRGPIDMDIFLNQGNYMLLEINPRFGGGYPHAYQCGIDFMKYIIKNVQGDRNIPEIGCYEEGKVFLKYTDAIMVDEDKEKMN